MPLVKNREGSRRQDANSPQAICQNRSSIATKEHINGRCGMEKSAKGDGIDDLRIKV